jgi:uncharacterized protein (TIGR02996 family)
MTHTDPSAGAFMRRILADPADPLPRLVFADWLEETGTSSNLAWARFLRLADELANAPAEDSRRPKLADELERVGSLVRARLTYRAEVFVAYPDALRQLLPTRNMVLNLGALTVPRRVVDLIPGPVAHDWPVLPLVQWGPTLAVAAPDPEDWGLSEFLRSALRRGVLLVRAPLDQLWAAVERHYDPANNRGAGGRRSFADTAVVGSTPLVLWPVDGDVSVVRLVNQLIGEAIQARAARLELEPRPDRLQVWHELGGERRPLAKFPQRLAERIAARVRAMADLPPAAKAAEFGEIPLQYRGLWYRLGVRIAPTPHGPHIQIAIPATATDPPAVVNPAA